MPSKQAPLPAGTYNGNGEKQWFFLWQILFGDLFLFFFWKSWSFSIFEALIVKFQK